MIRKALDLSVLTERRVLAPYGMAGGEPGRKGQNTLVNSPMCFGSGSIFFLRTMNPDP